MFGTYRLVLALMVVWHHLVDQDHNGFAGPVAVFGFYCLSGYLMTKVVNETYSDGAPGFARYLTNRALRIYPTYFVALAFSAGVLMFWPTAAAKLSEFYTWPDNWITNLTIIGLRPFQPILVAPAWSLHVELIYYILIGALLGRSRLATVGWFVFSLQFVVLGRWLRPDISPEYFYFEAVPASIAFATGASVYHFRNHLPRSGLVGAIGATAVVLFGFILSRPAGWAGGFYIGLALAAVTIAMLRDIKPPQWDRWLGDLAYPVFLFHMAAGAIAFGIFGSGATGLIVALVATALLSWLSVVIIERPLRSMRSALRGHAFLYPYR